MLLFSSNSFAQNTPKNTKIDYAQSVLKEGLQTKDSVKIAEGYYLLGKVEIARVNLAEGYRLFYLSLGISKKLKDFYKVGRIYLRLSEEELNQGHYNESKILLKEAIDVFEEHNIEKGKQDAYHLAGTIYLDYRYSNIGRADMPLKFDSSLYFFKKLETLALSQENEKSLSGARFQLGFIYKYLNDRRAISYLEYAVGVKQKEDPDSPLLVYRTSLASAYLIFGDLSKARAVLKQSQSLVDEGLPFDSYALATHYQTWAEYCRATGNWQKAYDFREKSMLFRLSIVEADRGGNVSKWLIMLETEKKDLALKLQKVEIENKQKHINQQRYWLAAGVVFLSILSVLSYFLYKNYQKQRILSQRNVVLMQEQNHRVKNNLQVISSLLNLQAKHLNDTRAKTILADSKLRIESMVLLHRQLYENDDAELINIEELFRAIATSVALTFGFSDIETNLIMPARWLKTDTAVALGLIVNELIINSFKYIFTGNVVPKIEISSRQSENIFEIIYKDFGAENIERKLSEKTKKTFGMKLIEMLLFQIDGTLRYNHQDGSAFTISFQNL